MTSKVCPVCQRSWGESFRFCPEDGTALPEAKVASQPARKGVDRRAEPSRSAPTVVMEARTQAEPSSAQQKTDSGPKEGRQKKKKGFSETAWFMQKIDPTMVDPETGRIVADTTSGAPDEIDPETRKRYSLRGEDEE